MTYGDLKHRVLQLIFSDTLAGTAIPNTYNNQSDYINMIPGLVNSAQYDIATSVYRIPTEKKLSALTVTHETYCDLYTLPSDCWQIMNGGLLCADRLHRFHDFKIMANGKLRTQLNLSGDQILEYWRYPTEVTSSSADSTALDNAPHVHEAVVFYVAAGLLAYDDEYRAQLFRTEYTTRKNSLREPVWLEPQAIINRYRGEEF